MRSAFLIADYHGRDPATGIGSEISGPGLSATERQVMAFSVTDSKRCEQLRRHGSRVPIHTWQSPHRPHDLLKGTTMTITLTIDSQCLLDDASLDRISLRELIVVARSQGRNELTVADSREAQVQLAIDEEEAITWEDAEWQ